MKYKNNYLEEKFETESNILKEQTIREELMKNNARIWWKWINTTSA